MKKIAISAAAITLMLGFGTVSAFADDCSGRDHTTGTVLGAVGGAAIGGAASRGNGLGIIGGALLGGLAGNAISRDMDCNDRPYAARSYDQSFNGRIGQRSEWRNGRNRGYIVTDREYRRNGRLCRDFTQVTFRNGREFDRHGTACRSRGGDWQFM